MSERELNYPIKVLVVSSDDSYVVTKGSEESCVNMVGEDGTFYENIYSEDQVARWIKSGDYIVESSGSPLKDSTTSSISITLSAYSDKLKRLAEASKAAYEAIESVNAVLKELEEIDG